GGQRVRNAVLLPFSSSLLTVAACAQQLWDIRTRHSTGTLQHKFAVTAVSFNDAADQVLTGGIDNVIKVWDLRRNEQVLSLEGHDDTVTGVSLSPDGSYLLSNSMDNTLRYRIRIASVRTYMRAA